MSKIVYILRGVSGAGKSTLAAELAPSSHICCADDFFMEDGKYVWREQQLNKAHLECFKKYFELLELGYGPVVVANTNTTEREVKKYLDAAQEFGYTVISLVIENRHGGKNIHSVPDHVLEKQEQNLKRSLKLR